MSMFDHAAATCSQCGAEAECEVVLSVNADRRPDLRTEILAGTFQAVACRSCGTQLRIPPEFAYLDMGRGQWIETHPADQIDRWPEIERAAAETFNTGFGRDAPDFVREIAAGVEPSVVFGWPAMRERLIARELGLASAPLELLKLAMMAQGQLVWNLAQELRLIDGDAATLHFDLVDIASEEPQTRLEIAREAYDAIAADPEPWAPLREVIVGGLFIDMRRAMVATLVVG